MHFLSVPSVPSIGRLMARLLTTTRRLATVATVNNIATIATVATLMTGCATMFSEKAVERQALASVGTLEFYRSPHSLDFQ